MTVFLGQASTITVATNKIAMDACLAEAARLGYNILSLSSMLEGEATQATSPPLLPNLGVHCP